MQLRHSGRAAAVRAEFAFTVGAMNRTSTRSTTPPPSRSRVSPTLTIIMYNLPAAVARECEELASELRLGRVEVKHLQSACAALVAHPRAFLLASVAIKSWDRQILEEHADRAGTTLRWVDDEGDTFDVMALTRTWAAEAIRRARTGR